MLGGVERVEHDGVCEGVGRQVDRALGGGDESRIDRIKSLFGGIVDLCASAAETAQMAAMTVRPVPTDPVAPMVTLQTLDQARRRQQ